MNQQVSLTPEYNRLPIGIQEVNAAARQLYGVISIQVHHRKDRFIDRREEDSIICEYKLFHCGIRNKRILSPIYADFT